MIDFESYVKTNWSVPDSTSCGIKYTHTSRVSVDKKSNVTVINHTINMTLSWFDKDNNLLQTEKLAFTNDDMNKTYDKKMLTINRQELVNKFRAAKTQIVRKIIDEKNEKLLKINDEINSLQSYIGREDDIIPQQMKNKIEISRSDKVHDSSTESKTHVDM